MANLNGLTTATTFVGIIELVLSILLFTQVGIDLLAPGSKDVTHRHFSVLGLHLANLEEWAALQNGDWWFGVEVSLVVFSIVYAVGSGLLILGCMWRNRRLTVPWLVMSACSIVCQVISLSLRQHTKPYSLNDWEMMIAIWNIIVCVGIWTLVFKTQKRWARLRRNPAASTVTYSFEREESSVTTPLLGSSEPTAVGSHQALGQQDAPLDKVKDKSFDSDPAAGSKQPLGQQNAPLDKVKDTSLDSGPAVVGTHQPLGQQDTHLDKVQDRTSLDTDPAAESKQPVGQQDAPVEKVRDTKSLDKVQDTTSLDSDPIVAGSHQPLGQQDAPLDKVQDTTLPLADPAVPQVAPAQSPSAVKEYV